MTVSCVGEINVSSSTLPLISAVSDNYGLSPISLIVDVDLEKDLPITEAKKKHIIDILKNCHQTMAKNDKLLLLATIITNSVASNNQQSCTEWLDLAMFFMTGGADLRETEYRKLLATAGFELTKIVNTQSSNMIEAVKV